VEGWLLDAGVCGGGLRLVVALPGGGLASRCVGVGFRVFLLPLGVSAGRLAGGLEGVDAWVEEWWAPPWYDRAVSVVVVEGGLGRVVGVARRLERLGVARRVNRYPGVVVEALWRLGACPGCLVRLGGGVELLEDPGDPLYGAPGLVVARVEGYRWYGPLAVPWEEPDYYVVECRGWRERVAGEEGVLGALARCRPHLVVARGSVAWRLRGAAGPRGEGWLWFDPERNLVGPWGLVEWMRVSWLPYREAHGAPIGRVLTAAEAREAYRRRLLVDPEAPRGEGFRSLRALTAADMAGAARLPRPGLYWGVVQLDYSSLYPTLIASRNIGAETVERPGCTSYVWAPPGAPRPCSEPRGLVPEVLGRLVERRRRIRGAAAGDPLLGERAEALKWILVSGFGYLGYRNSLFGSITAYEAVTAYARWALAVAEEEAERAGYRLVHSIVDSVFIAPVDPRVGPERLAERIRERTGVPVRVEARYTWLYIPPTLSGRGAVNKYYGALEGGGVKVKGVLAVRRDAPPLIAGAQRAAIRALAKARSPGEWPGALGEARRRVEWYRRLIASGRAPLRGLVIARRLGDGPRARGTPWGRAARGVLAGVVRYVVTPRGPAPVWEDPGEYDVEYYLGVLGWALRELPPLDAEPPPDLLVYEGA